MSRRLAFVYHPASFETLEIAEAARGVCDLIWVIDTSMPEVGSMQRLLRRLGDVVDVTGLTHDEAAEAIAAARPDGILALHDALLEWTAAVAERLGLGFHSVATAANLADKRAQRAALRAGGLAVPRTWPVPASFDDADGWARLGEEAEFPAVVKPRHGELSRDTLRVDDLGALRAAVAGIAERGPRRAAGLVLEQYIRDRPDHAGPFGDYVSVESIVSHGRISHLAVNGRFPPVAPFRETGFFIPSALPGDERDAVLDVATAAIRATGVDRGCLHTEIKMTPDGPWVIEVNGRIGGGVIDMLRRAAGLELMPIALRLALGDMVSFDGLLECDGVACILLVQPDVGVRRVEAIEGLSELGERPDVEAVLLRRGPGAEVDWRAGTNEYIALITGRVPDHDALAALGEHVRATVHVHGAPSPLEPVQSGC